MIRRRVVVFRRKGAAPAAAAARPVLFVSPVPPLLPDPLAGHDFDAPATSRMVDVLCKAAVDADDAVMSFADEHRANAARERLARGIDAWSCGRPLDADLIHAVLEHSS